MDLWRCPHCATPQPESGRCWVCKRSSTSCATCRNFRRSIAVQIGYCGLDRRRLPLLGDEIRACWQPGTAADETVLSATDADAPPLVRAFDFVPLGEDVAVGPGRADRVAPIAVGLAGATLWDDATDR